MKLLEEFLKKVRQPLSMDKYLSVFRISLSQELVYKVNFLMWRLRNIIQFFTLFFLWDTLLSKPGSSILGYDKSKILTYAFGTLIIKSIVFSSKSADVAGEIARGDLSNYLLKPLSYFAYWFSRDTANKVLNLTFATLEVSLLYFLLQPPLYFPVHFGNIILFVISIIFATFLYYLLILIFSTIPFWNPEQAWGAVFIFLIFSDFLGGGLFPLDVLPNIVQKFIYLTPFPYLLFVPSQIYLEKVNFIRGFGFTAISGTWIFLLILLLRFLWNKGMLAYRGEGR